MATADEQRPGIRPRPTWGRRLDVAARHAFPASSTILLMLLTQAPFGITGQAALLPAVTFASVWFWSLYRPTAMSPPVVFVVGLLFDLLGWMPLGAGVLTLLLVYGLAQQWRRALAHRGILMVWLSFAVIAAGASALDWALSSLLSWRLLPPGPAVFQTVLAAAAYPALAIVFARAHRSVASPERA